MQNAESGFKIVVILMEKDYFFITSQQWTPSTPLLFHIQEPSSIIILYFEVKNIF